MIEKKKCKMVKNVLMLILGIVLVVSFSGGVFGATINAISCEQVDVQTAIDSAVDGDTVLVPAGECEWTISGLSNLIIPIGVSLMGAGNDGSGTNITIISYTQPAYNNFGIKLWSNTRLSGFSFDGNLVAPYLILFDGTGNRIDHNLFFGFITPGRPIYAREESNNLIDHNEFYACGLGISASSIINSWSEDTNFGSDDFLFIEDNNFYNTRDSPLQSCQRPVEVGNGHKVVMRYNKIYIEQSGTNMYNNQLLDAHGYCHGPSSRATRAIEVYENEVIQTGTPSYVRDSVYIRGGTALIYNNTWRSDAEYVESSVTLYDWRASQNGDSTGQSSCYATPPNTEGKYYCWENGYRIAVLDDVGSMYGVSFSFGDTLVGVTSGASGIIRGFGDASPGHLYFFSITNGPFVNGENLQIESITITTAVANSEAYSGEGYPCTDQLGRGKDQTSEPVYMWNNRDQYNNITGVSAPRALSGYFTENVDYVLSEYDYIPYTYPHPLILLGETTCTDAGGTCQTNTCDTYTDCVELTGTCVTGNCCLGTCTASSTCGPADTDSDGVVSIIEVMNYITEWKAENVDIVDLMIGIGEWKNGCS